MKKSTLYRKILWLVTVFVTLWSTVPIPIAQAVVTRSYARTNVNRNVNVNRNANVSRNVNVNVDDDDDYHPFAAAAAGALVGAATAAVIGSVVHSKPPNCVPVTINGVTFLQCGSTWYQPQYAGTQVTYVVVNSPK